MADAGHGKNETEALLKLVSMGNEAAAARLLNLHRRRLKKMVSLRIDEDVAARRDPSDVVHETMLAAARQLPDYIRKPDIPFYAWLRCLAWDRLVDLHRQHSEKKRESPKADVRQGQLTRKSLSELVRRFGPPSSSKGPTADGKDGAMAAKTAKNSEMPVSRRQAHARVEAALVQLEPGARELLLLYYVEQLTVPEIASVLEIESGQVKLRHVRAIRKLRSLLGQSDHGASADTS